MEKLEIYEIDTKKKNKVFIARIVGTYRIGGTNGVLKTAESPMTERTNKKEIAFQPGEFITQGYYYAEE